MSSVSRIAGALILVLAVSGCAATNRIVSQWTNPEYASHSFDRIMVIGISDRTSIRRAFEDRFEVYVPRRRFTTSTPPGGRDTISPS